jgi:hypothetical protein
MIVGRTAGARSVGSPIYVGRSGAHILIRTLARRRRKSRSSAPLAGALTTEPRNTKKARAKLPLSSGPRPGALESLQLHKSFHSGQTRLRNGSSEFGNINRFECE